MSNTNKKPNRRSPASSEAVSPSSLELTPADQLIRNRVGELDETGKLERTQIIRFNKCRLPSDLAETLGFSLLMHPISGAHYGEPGFRPFWTSLRHHDGWFEMDVSFFGEDGFTFVLFIESHEDSDPTLRTMLLEFSERVFSE